jgi:hypothetical protein
MEARAHEAALGGGENFAAAIGLQLGVGPAHDGIPPIPELLTSNTRAAQQLANERSLSSLAKLGLLKMTARLLRRCHAGNTSGLLSPASPPRLAGLLLAPIIRRFLFRAV